MTNEQGQSRGRGLSRRTALTGLAASAVALALPPGRISAAVAGLSLKAGPALARLNGANGPQTAVWAFDGLVPGPVLRARQGEEFAVRFANQLTEPSAVHWHGLRIANAMDGVPGLTQAAVAPGAEFAYRFTPPDAGTFWYHPHERSFEQVPRGLTGALIVEERTPPKADQDLVLLINDWRIDGAGQLIGGFGSRHDQVHAGRLGNHITVNGLPLAEFPVLAHERVRLRIINACSARVLTLQLEASQPKLIAVDGQPVGPTTSYGEALILGPGNRVDLMVDMIGGAGHVIPLAEVSGARQELARLVFQGAQSRRPEPLVAPIALAPNRLPEPDRKDALVVPLVMTGGGKSETDMSLMMGAGPVWQFNGAAGMMMAANAKDMAMGEPLFRAPRGRTVHIRFENQTAWPHAMHVHGHHFRLLERAGGPPPQPFWWDTLLVQPGETSTIGFVADNPGKWMLHCHMLDHQASGMDAWFEVG